MGLEQHPFEGTPLGAFAQEAQKQTECIVELDDKQVKIFPQPDNSFKVYVEDRFFTITETNDGLTVSDDTPSEHQGGWLSESYKVIAVQAVQENYLTKM